MEILLNIITIIVAAILHDIVEETRNARRVYKKIIKFPTCKKMFYCRYWLKKNLEFNKSLQDKNKMFIFTKISWDYF